MKEYSAYLIFDDIDQKKIERIKKINANYDLEIDFGKSFLEIDYQGRDEKKNIVKYFCELALVLESADGELVCEIVNDDGDNEFKFFTINDGKVVCQNGRIVRSEEKIVINLNEME